MIRGITIAFLILIVSIIWIVDTGRGTAVLDMVHRIPLGDKMGHFFLMGILSLLVNLSLKLRTFTVWGREVLLGTTLVLIVVTLEELSQGFVPTRNLSFQDWVADFLGIVLAGRLAQILYPQLFKQQS
ncbi:MAG: VanZ family protein [Bacteroidota bacterium]